MVEQEINHVSYTIPGTEQGTVGHSIQQVKESPPLTRLPDASHQKCELLLR